MKYLKSSTNKRYNIRGKNVPQNVTPNNDWLALSDEEFIQWQKKPAVKSLMDAGAILVSDHAPTHPLAAQANASLKNELAEKDRLFNELKTEAETALAEKDKLIAELQAQLKAKKGKKETE